MKLRLIEILLVHLISITLCIATQYDCDKMNISCGCGFKNVNINEQSNNLEEIIPHSWSMIVSIRYDCHRNGDPSTHCCNGIILNDRYVLTAARCFDSIDNSSLLSDNITIVAGIHSLSQSCSTIRVVEQKFIHPDWTSMNETLHNIAILRLAEPFDFHKDFILRQTCLPSEMNTFVDSEDNKTLALVGWNHFSNSIENTNKVLQQLLVHPIYSNDSQCASTVDHNSLLFCAGRLGASRFPGVGAALFRWNENHWELVGIQSYATNHSSQIGYTGLFLRVAAYNKWIESITYSDSVTTSSTEVITTPPKPLSMYECNRTALCGCGYSDVVFRSTRIIGGENVIEGSWSMIVSIRFYENEEHSCAGTLLSSSFVLTAAHCVDHIAPTNLISITINAGITNLSDSNGYQRRVEKIHLHPNYTGLPPFLNNIALLQLDRPLYFQDNPILAKTCVHRTNSSISINEQHPNNGTRLAIIGWGAMRPESVSLSNYLKQIQVYAIDNRDPICKNVRSDDELQFCAGLYYGEKDACLGDSGGPVLYWTGHYWEQVGVIGHNYHCGRPGYPGVYTRLSYYWQWMEHILNMKTEYLEPQNPSPFPTTTTTTRLPRTRTTNTRVTASTSTTFSNSTTTVVSETPFETTTTTHSGTPLETTTTTHSGTSTGTTTTTTHSGTSTGTTTTHSGTSTGTTTTHSGTSTGTTTTTQSGTPLETTTTTASGTSTGTTTTHSGTPLETTTTTASGTSTGTTTTTHSGTSTGTTTTTASGTSTGTTTTTASGTSTGTTTTTASGISTGTTTTTASGTSTGTTTTTASGTSTGTTTTTASGTSTGTTTTHSGTPLETTTTTASGTSTGTTTTHSGTPLETTTTTASGTSTGTTTTHSGTPLETTTTTASGTSTGTTTTHSGTPLETTTTTASGTSTGTTTTTHSGTSTGTTTTHSGTPLETTTTTASGTSTGTTTTTHSGTSTGTTTTHSGTSTGTTTTHSGTPLETTTTTASETSTGTTTTTHSGTSTGTTTTTASGTPLETMTTTARGTSTGTTTTTTSRAWTMTTTTTSRAWTMTTTTVSRASTMTTTITSRVWTMTTTTSETSPGRSTTTTSRARTTTGGRNGCGRINGSLVVLMITFSFFILAS